MKEILKNTSITSKNHRIIFFVESHFSLRDFKRFGIDFLSQEFEVIIFDCTPLIRPAFEKNLAVERIVLNNLIAVSSYEQIYKRLRNVSGSLIAIDCLQLSRPADEIRKFIHAEGILHVSLRLGTLPGASFYDKLFFFLANPIKFYEKVLSKLTSNERATPANSDVVVYAGRRSLDNLSSKHPPVLLPAHSFDYDIFLKLKDSTSSSPTSYAVFLDENMVFHTDYEYCGVKPPATANQYFTALSTFFDQFEKLFKIPVIIAQHPRSQYDSSRKLWGTREVINGQTASLVRDCKIVLCHQSTSVSFAVLWCKPILFLTSNEIKRSFLGFRIKKLSHILRSPLINVDVQNTLSSIEVPIHLDVTSYQRYTEDYIKTKDTRDISLWHVFSDFIKSLP